jgi:hypothetical protein
MYARAIRNWLKMRGLCEKCGATEIRRREGREAIRIDIQ